ncbi:MAG: response regulator transcription factor [Fibrobacteria bacterium]|nr:response regulator transcription factor [Fibrobacteria bacterium]
MNDVRRILLVEDDEPMALGLEFNLRDDGYETVHCLDGESGLARALEGGFDLVILDMLLPGINGLEVLQGLRAKDVRTPVLILSASAGADSIVEGLNAGADDYLGKPFDLGILMARIRTLIRSREWLATGGGTDSEPEIMRFAGREVDFRRSLAHVDGQEVELSYKEAMLLKALWDQRGETLTRDRLLREVWGYADGVQTRTIDTFVLALRKKLEPDPKKPRYIQTVIGEGYRFSPD